MAKKINITAQLNAATTDGILASANQIYDENKGKFQEQVNQEVENALEETITSEDTGMVVESIEEGIIHNALRKTEQILTEAEKGQARENIGAVSEQTFENEAVRVKKQVFTSEQKYQARHNISAITAEEAEKIAQDKINESAVSSPDKLQAVKELSSWLESNPDNAATMNAAIQENAADIQRLYRGTGIDEYSEFSSLTDYAAGAVVLYDGVQFRFKVDHAKGAWDYNEVEDWSEKKEREEKLAELESKTDKNSIVSVESNNILQGAIYEDGSFHDDGSGWEYVLFLVAPNDKITFKASGYNTNVISFYALGQTPSVNTYIDGMASDGNGSSSYKEYNAIAKDFLIAAISWYRPYGTPSISIERTSLIDNLDSIMRDYEEKFSMTESELRRKQNVIKNISETGTEENSSSLIIYDDKDNKISEVDANICDEEDEEQIWESEGGDKYASIGNYGIKAKAFEDLDGNKFLAHNADISNLNILIFGDSITDCTNIGLDETNIRTTSYSYHGNGYNNEQGQYVTFKMWAYMLNSILKCKDLRCYARSGATWKDSPTGGLTDGYTNLREMMSYQVRLAINDLDNPNSIFPTQGRYNPDIIICALGTNDGLNKNDTYESAMEKTMYKEDGKTIDIDATLQNLDRTKFCEAVRWSLLTLKHNFPYAILMVVLPLQRADFEQGRNTELRKMAERYGAVIIDGYSEMGIIRDTETTNNNVDLGDTTITINSGIYLKDGLHPNDKGQNLFARLIISYIKRYYISFEGMNV